MHITGRTRDENGNNHGKVLEFRDADGVLHVWPMPMEMLAGDCSEFRSMLMSSGLEMSTSSRARQLLTDYVQQVKPDKAILCVPKTGWHKGKFVLPSGSIGDIDEPIMVQGKAVNCRVYAFSGTLSEWQEHILKYTLGNSRLIFAICSAFAAPCLELLGMEGGGFHFRCQSSLGKTTLLRVAASVCGDPTSLRKWRATVNGLEVTAFQHNDMLLCLDEMGEINGQDIGAAAYMLVNGSGKGRARADGGLRDSLTWRLLFLSTGEISLTSHMEEAGKRSKAGQEIRLADIPADTEEHGVFEQIHGHSHGGVFADMLKDQTKKYYGTAIRAFLQRLVFEREEAKRFIEKQMSLFLDKAIPKNAPGQIYRVATRFAFVGAAGELAIHYGIARVMGSDGLAEIGWDEGMALEAAMRCFNSWLKSFGGLRPQEETKLVADTLHFLEQHGESRFTDYSERLSDGYPSKTYQRAGFRRSDSDSFEFLLFPETFKREICKGLEEHYVKRVLFDHGVLKKDSQGKFSCSMKPASEMKSRRFVVLMLPTEKQEE